jgi:hypothetical protein
MRPSIAHVVAGIAIMSLVLVSNAYSRPVVVELFTSQGCSSCPPAEAYLGKLAARSDVIALSFHVTYWDDLGWRDRFGLTEAVDRQNVYARNLRRSSVYTPQLIVDGASDSVGANGQTVEQALIQQRDGVARDGVPHDGVLVDLKVDNQLLQVEIGANPHLTAGEVILVSYLRHAVSDIGRGENAGRKLEEFNIVRSIRKLGRWSGQAEHFQIPVASLPADATDVAVLVQGAGQAPIVGAGARPVR